VGKPSQSALEPKGAIDVKFTVTRGRDNPGAIMTTVQAITFGAMLSWTPSLIVMTILLWNVPELDEEDQPRF
jgi:hypothetical protein